MKAILGLEKTMPPENLAVFRHYALSALKQLSEPKRGLIRRKRKNCTYDLDLLASAVGLILS